MLHVFAAELLQTKVVPKICNFADVSDFILQWLCCYNFIAELTPGMSSDDIDSLRKCH